MSIGLDDRELTLIKSVFKKHERIVKVYVFGSRAKGNFRKNSDIDLVVFGDLSMVSIEEIALQLFELPLPYKYDVQSYDNIINSELKIHIDRVGILIYDKGSIQI